MKPNKDFVSDDQKVFLVDYQLGQKTYSVRIWAKSFKEAKKHVKALQASSKVTGQLYQSEPVLGGIH
jgi:hypothetical protein